MTPERVALMPAWPARMGDDLAALYLGVSPTTFRERVKARAYPQPDPYGNRTRVSAVKGEKPLESTASPTFPVPFLPLFINGLQGRGETS
jgi:hypothetical protein